MFREMRRSSQQLTMEETQNILQKGTSGVLSLLGDEGYPYGVPLSYVYDGEKLYFHCAKTGLSKKLNRPFDSFIKTFIINSLA